MWRITTIKTCFLERYISDQCASSNRSNSGWCLLFFSFFFSVVLRRSSDFILIASLPNGAVSVLGLGCGGDFSVASCGFAAASSSSTSLRACASASFRRMSASLGVLVGIALVLVLAGTSVVALTGTAGFALLVGLDSAIGCDAAVGSFGLAAVRFSSGCFGGDIISQAGSVGLDGAEDEDMGRNIVICEWPHSSLICLGE